MSAPAPSDARYTAERYLRLVDEGLLGPDDRVELLEGVIVAMAPQDPPHASVVSRLTRLLSEAVGPRAVIRVQLPFNAGAHSVPEPDVALVPGADFDYAQAHPTTALLIVEVADSSVVQNRLTKAAIYAAADVPEYWLVNLRDDCVEVFRAPEPEARRYRSSRLAQRGDALDLVALPDARVAVGDLLPPR